MKKPLLVIPIVLLAQGLVFGQSEEKKLELWQPLLWKADDPRIANPINRFHFKNPLAPANRFHLSFLCRMVFKWIWSRKALCHPRHWFDLRVG